MNGQGAEPLEGATPQKPAREPASTSHNEQDRAQVATPRPPGGLRPPLKWRLELKTVDGEEGKLLSQRQAAAIRNALRWLERVGRHGRRLYASETQLSHSGS
jgi:hypothetical protein